MEIGTINLEVFNKVNYSMKFQSSVVAIALASLAAESTAFQPVGVSSRATRGQEQIALRVASPEIEEETKTENGNDELKTLTQDLISKLRFREAVKELELRELDASGTLTDMRSRLRELVPDSGIQNSNAADADVRVIQEETLNNVRRK